MKTPFSQTPLRYLLALAGLAGMPAASLADPPVVPGTGQRIVQVGDDFEDLDWDYQANGAKSSRNIDENVRSPTGRSTNGRWFEGAKRGQPDIVRRIETPPGGLEGSEGSMLLQSLYTGIPRRPSYRLQQDDFICDVMYRLGGTIPVWQTPNFVCRVFLPPVDQWENRSGPHFAIRAAVDTQVRKQRSSGLFGSSSSTERETYWPGMFIEFQTKGQGEEHDYAYIRMRADSSGRDYRSLQITQTGWWTFGMSFTPDGQVHYYASQGVDPLTEADHLGSQFPYGYRAQRFRTFFFNVCNGDDGSTWSTPWIVDDSHVYYLPTASTATRPGRGSTGSPR